MIIWPFGCVEHQGYGIDHARDKMQQVYQGNPFGRRTSRAPNHFFNFSHHFTREQLVEFDTFYEQTLQGGLLPFVVEYMEDGHGQGAREIVLIGDRKPASTPEGIGYRLNFRAVWRRDVELITDAAPPVASFTFTESAGLVSFTDTSTDDIGVVSWLWDFGDGTTSTEQNPNKTYSFGSYTVTLEVTDAVGGVSQSTQEVAIAYQGGWIDLRDNVSGVGVDEYPQGQDISAITYSAQYSTPTFDSSGLRLAQSHGAVFRMLNIDQNSPQKQAIKYVVNGGGFSSRFALHWGDYADLSRVYSNGIFGVFRDTSAVNSLSVIYNASTELPRAQAVYTYGKTPKDYGFRGSYYNYPERFELSSPFVRLEITNSGLAGGVIRMYQLDSSVLTDALSWDGGELVYEIPIINNVPNWGVVSPSYYRASNSNSVDDGDSLIAIGLFDE